MNRTLFLFSHTMLDNPPNTDASQDTFATWSYIRLSNYLGSQIPINPVYIDNSVRDAWFVNGQYQPTQNLYPGEWHIFDMICASGDRILEIEIRTDIGIIKNILI